MDVCICKCMQICVCMCTLDSWQWIHAFPTMITVTLGIHFRERLSVSEVSDRT